MPRNESRIPRATPKLTRSDGSDFTQAQNMRCPGKYAVARPIIMANRAKALSIPALIA
ncbi:MAG TPA: hypothetical protein VGC79_05620 [Polyangiaceae bacterium]